MEEIPETIWKAMENKTLHSLALKKFQEDIRKKQNEISKEILKKEKLI